MTQRRFYSGKKKAHTLKNQIVVHRRPHDNRPHIAAVSPSRCGSMHDKKIYDRSRMTNAKGIARDADTGYHGTAMRTPHKKPKGGKLTDEQKTKLAAIREEGGKSNATVFPLTQDTCDFRFWTPN